MEANNILTAIVQGMRKEELRSETLLKKSSIIYFLCQILYLKYISVFSNQVRLAATTALYNSLEFTKGNFDKEVFDHSVYMR